MNYKELRIGNLINYNDGGIYVVTGIHEFGLDVEDENETTYMEHENFSPIQLTEEWLLKFGFDKCEFNIPKKYKKQGCNFSVKFRNENGFTVEYKHGHVCLKHVHQLQNLYFALTGEELTLQQP